MSGKNTVYKAYQLVKEHGEKGIPQHQLWKRLGLNGRKGSQIAKKLEHWLLKNCLGRDLNAR